MNSGDQRGASMTASPSTTRSILRWLSQPLIGLSAVLHLLVLVGLLLHPDRWLLALLIILANHALLVAFSLWPRSAWIDSNITHLPGLAAPANRIALTIDDGPDPEVTPKVLESLERLGIKATFFCVGERVAAYPDLAREIVRRGHALENHTQRHHWYFSLMGTRGLRGEIARAQATISAVTGTTPRYFRAPAGLRNPLLGLALIQERLRLVSWTRRGFDTVNAEPLKILQSLTRGLRDGDILLLHDGHAARAADGTPVILAVLPELAKRVAGAGLRFVTLPAGLD